MLSCEQTEGCTIMQHGLSVWDNTKKLASGQHEGFKLPKWFTDNHSFIANSMHHPNTTKDYNVYHDCGKPRCLTTDADGRRHFPDHARASQDAWEGVGGCPTVGRLIGMDMILHTETAEGAASMITDPTDAATLVVTAFAELHANAAMFGGTDSVSFKIKYKKVERNSRAVLRRLLEEAETHEYSYVIVRADLPPVTQAVQGTHAAMEAHSRRPYRKHPSVVYVHVKNEDKLKRVVSELLDSGVAVCTFREPMDPHNNSMTAACTEPLSGERRERMKRFMLARF